MIRYLIMLLIAGILSALLYYRTQPALTGGRRALMIFLRTISIFCILVLLISPILHFWSEDKFIPQVIILRDTSRSMTLSGSSGPKDQRINPAWKQVSEAYTRAGYQVLPVDFADGLAGGDQSTRLGLTLEQIAQKQDLSRVTGIVLASDGWFRDENLALVTQFNIPFTVLTDTTGVNIADLAVSAVRSPRFAYRNEPAMIAVDLAAMNWTGRAQVTLRINGREAEQKPLTILDSSTHSLSFVPRFSQTGFYTYQVEVSAPGLNERSLNNNVHPGAIEVLAEKERIAIISDKPGWDNKYIIDALNRNPRWLVEHYSIRNQRLYLGSEEKGELSETGLTAILIINNGALNPSPLLADRIVALNHRGIGILYQGAPIDALARINPLQRSNVSSSYQGFVQLLPEARRLPMFDLPDEEIAKIPPVDYHYVTARAGTSIIATLNNPQQSPAIALIETSGNRCIGIGILNLWRWQMQVPGDAYSRLFTNLVTWLGNQAQHRFTPIHQSSYFLGEPVSIRLRSDDEIRRSRLDSNPRLKITDEQDDTVFEDFMTVDGSDFRIDTTINKPGNYRFSITDRDTGEQSTGRFHISDSSLEDRDFDFNLPLLSWIAHETGGRLIKLPDAASFTVPAVQPEITIRRNELHIYRYWYFLAAFILIFCLELFLRRRWGLI